MALKSFQSAFKELFGNWLVPAADDNGKAFALGIHLPYNRVHVLLNRKLLLYGVSNVFFELVGLVQVEAHPDLFDFPILAYQVEKRGCRGADRLVQFAGHVIKLRVLRESIRHASIGGQRNDRDPQRAALSHIGKCGRGLGARLTTVFRDYHQGRPLGEHVR